MQPIRVGDEVVHRDTDVWGIITSLKIDKALVQWSGGEQSWEKIGDLLKCPEWSDGTDD